MKKQLKNDKKVPQAGRPSMKEPKKSALVARKKSQLDRATDVVAGIISCIRTT